MSNKLMTYFLILAPDIYRLYKYRFLHRDFSPVY